LRQRLTVQPLVEDRADRAVGTGPDLEPTTAGGLETIRAVLAGEPEDAEAGAEALLGMRPAAQDDLDESGGVAADGGGLAQEALVGPAGVATVGARHMVGQRGVPAARTAQQMTGNPLPLVEQLDYSPVMRASTSWRSSRCGTE
jgi:hypothetical protein